MKNLTKLFVVVLLLSASLISAKGKYGVIGKIYTSERALELYGPVQKSIAMEKQDLSAMLSQCENYMLFKIKNNEIIIADENKNVLTNNKVYLSSSILNFVTKNDVITDDEYMNLVSKSRVLEIINSTDSDVVKFEVRQKVETISSTAYVLELVQWFK